MPDIAAELTLETVLEIWQSTTARLEQTHLTLQAEVRRLTEELEEKNRQLAKQNRLADLGQMAGHVAHEVRNHLVPLTLYLSMLRRQLGEQAPAAGTIAEGGSPRRGALQPSELLDKVENNIAAMRIMVHDLLNFTANRQPQRQEVDVRATAGELLEEIAPQCAAQNIRLECQVDDDLTLSCDPEMLRSAVRNLLLNAVDALGGGGTICLTVRPDGDYVRVEVRDNGPGIPAETMARIFDPFFTTKPTGTGLGLSVVERVMECHHGQVRVHRVEPHGTGFRLMFPSHLGRNRT